MIQGDLSAAKIANHKQIKIEDFNVADIIKYFDETYEFIEENLKNSNVLVHC